MKTKRNSGTEILRIIAMLMIVCHHFAVHGGIDFHNQFNDNTVFINAMEFGGKLGVNIFVLITGYYSYKSNFSCKKIFKLIFASVFYSLILTTISILGGVADFNIKTIIRAFFPLILGWEYWFVAIYIVLFCLSPLLNAGINTISKNRYKIILIILLLIYCFLPNTFGLALNINDFGISTIIWFITLYLLGAYINKYPIKVFEKKHICIPCMCLSLITLLIGTTLKLYLETSGIDNRYIKAAVGIIGNTSLYSVMPLITALLLFIVFKNLNMPAPDWIMTVASSTFGIYLIHDNSMFRPFLWDTICNLTTMINSPYFILYSIVCIILIFAICSIIEILRLKFIESKFFSIAIIRKTINTIDKYMQ